MSRRRLWTSLLFITLLAAIVLGINLGLGNRPVLGLDLQGGVSVILRPEGGATDEDLVVIRDLVRDQLEQTGIAEPDVRVEGGNVIVDLPGVKDQQEALDAADVAGIVSFRPVVVCGVTPTSDPTGSSVPASAVPTSTPTTGTATIDSAPVDTGGAATTVAASTAATPAGFAGAARTVAPRSTTPPTDASVVSVPDSVPTTAEGTAPTSTPDSSLPSSTDATPTLGPGQSILRTLDGTQCVVGPTAGTGEIFNRNSASVEFGQQGWVVVAALSGSGEAAWNTVAGQCYNRTPECPSQQLAIVLDDIIQSAPLVQAPAFSGEVSISGMDETEARSLSRVIDRGAFPARVEPATVQTVSPTLGRDSLSASVFAGLVGVALVVLMLIVLYRYLTLLVLAGMIVWGMLIYSISVFISETTNYALTLAGVTGIIVSIGMTVDSYVIYFERLKDEVRHGRTLKNSAARAFKATWKTILAANLVSAIGAAVLFVLSVGSVRGFALYLGVTTVCDVLVLWFFTRPAVILFASTGWLDRRNTFGLEAPRPVTEGEAS